MSIECAEFERILEQQDAGALPQPARAHLQSCEACRALTADLDAIRDLAVELGAEGIEPPERIWVSLRNEMEAEGLIQDLIQGQEAAAVRGASPGWWTAFQRPAFAGVFLGIILAAAAAVGYLSDIPQTAVQTQLPPSQEASPVRSADSVFKEEILSVSNGSVPGMQRQDTAVADSIRRNLQLVDNLIAMCEKSVREQPDNQIAREYLYGAYQQKAELLATAMNRSMNGGLQ